MSEGAWAVIGKIASVASILSLIWALVASWFASGRKDVEREPGHYIAVNHIEGLIEQVKDVSVAAEAAAWDEACATVDRAARTASRAQGRMAGTRFLKYAKSRLASVEGTLLKLQAGFRSNAVVQPVARVARDQRRDLDRILHKLSEAQGFLNPQEWDGHS